MPYFRVSGSQNDLLLLPKLLRDNEDLSAVAAHAEADVITHFTRQYYHEDATVLDAGECSERYVYLRGFTEDAAEATDAFKAAMRRCVAEVIRWRLARDSKPANVASEGGKERSKDYRADAESSLPPIGWDAPLLPWRISSAPLYI